MKTFTITLKCWRNLVVTNSNELPLDATEEDATR